MWIDIVWIMAGFILLLAGADALVRGASGTAALFGITPLVIGLTVVAFGTSAPEFAVSFMAAFAGKSDIAIGNVVGSNIFNVLGILGAAALIVPLTVATSLVKKEVPLLIVVSLSLFLFALDGSLGRVEAAIYTLGIVAYTWWALKTGKQDAGTEQAKPTGSLPKHLAFLAFGLGLLILGSSWLVDGAVNLATRMGVSELVIGLTIVAIGTSLPEAATSIVAGIKGERDIAVGNIVGSNLFNILGILGITGLISPEAIPFAQHAMEIDLPVMILTALLCLPIFFTGFEISRLEGVLFLACFGLYTTYLVLEAAQSPDLEGFTDATLHYALPALALALGYSIFSSFRQPKDKTPSV